jgi:hypothetical protein
VKELRVYMAILVDTDGNLMMAAENGSIGYADKMVRIINSADLLCTALAVEFRQSPEFDLAELAELCKAVMRKTKAVQEKARELFAFGKGGVA